MSKKIISWLFVLLWLGVIFWFSNKNGLVTTIQSRGTSRILVEESVKVAQKIGILSKAPSEETITNFVYKINPYIRKIAHMVVYMILAIFIMFALKTDDKNFNKNLFITAVICFLYAITDEYHQTFIDARNGSFSDCLIDTLGAFMGCDFYRGFLKIKGTIFGEKRKNKMVKKVPKI